MQPKFWKHKNLFSLLLLPFAMLFVFGSFLRAVFARQYRADVPVICVGNVTVGGAGKTPVVLAITELLRNKHRNVAIASRGYKGEITKPTLVDKSRHTVHSVGDEPLMLARIAQTYIAAKRPLAIKMAQENGADIVIMDDGMQNPSVIKDLTFLVIDGNYGIGNGLVMPAGPLRESLFCAIAKADAIILVGNDETNILQHRLLRGKNAKPIIRAKLEPQGELPDTSRPYFAFAGIGNPDKFFATLASQAYNVVGEAAFDDHYNYSDQDINELIHKSEKLGADLITTEKDAVRLPVFARKKIKVLSVKIVWDDASQIVNLLGDILKK